MVQEGGEELLITGKEYFANPTTTERATGSKAATLATMFLVAKSRSFQNIVNARFRCTDDIAKFEVFEALKPDVSPDLIFTHNGADAHQDHRLLSELTWNTFRHHMILEYEIPKYDADIERPNVFVPLEETLCVKKTQHIMDTLQSQRSQYWFDESSFRALMRLRGMECIVPSGYAEAFYFRKIVL